MPNIMKTKSNANPKANNRSTSSLSARPIMLLIILFLGLCLLPRTQAQSPLPFYEPFPGTYLNNEELGSSTTSGGTSGGTSGLDRKSVVEGKRGDLDGRAIIIKIK